MFDLGTKVVVFISSLRKTAGPRRGSVGYVTSVSGKNGAYITDIGLSITPCEVIFTRYGFERSSRRERRPFLNLFPVVENAEKPEDISKLLKKSIRDLHKEKFDKEMWKRILKDWGLKPNTAIGMLVPICDSRTNLLKCGENEFMAWLDSYLMSADFRNILISIMRDNKTGVSGTWVNVLTDMAHDKIKKNDLMPKVAAQHREDIIKSVRIIAAIALGNYFRLDNISFRGVAGRVTNGRGSIRRQEIYKAFLDGLYSPAKYKPRQVILKGLKSDGVNKMIDVLERTKQLLGAFSVPLLRVGKERGKEVEELIQY